MDLEKFVYLKTVCPMRFDYHPIILDCFFNTEESSLNDNLGIKFDIKECCDRRPVSFFTIDFFHKSREGYLTLSSAGEIYQVDEDYDDFHKKLIDNKVLNEKIEFLLKKKVSETEFDDMDDSEIGFTVDINPFDYNSTMT